MTQRYNLGTNHASRITWPDSSYSQLEDAPCIFSAFSTAGIFWNTSWGRINSAASIQNMTLMPFLYVLAQRLSPHLYQYSYCRKNTSANLESPAFKMWLKLQSLKHVKHQKQKSSQRMMPVRILYILLLHFLMHNHYLHCSWQRWS